MTREEIAKALQSSAKLKELQNACDAAQKAMGMPSVGSPAYNAWKAAKNARDEYQALIIKGEAQ